MLDELKKYFKDHILQKSISYNQSGESIFHLSLVNYKKQCVGSGTSFKPQVATAKALMEAVERSYISKIRNSNKEQKKYWGFDKDESSNGFACGFNISKTGERALLEAYEKKIRNLWLKRSISLQPLNLDATYSSLFPKEILTELNKKRFFSHTGEIEGNSRKISTIIFAGESKYGFHLGSSSGFYDLSNNLISNKSLKQSNFKKNSHLIFQAITEVWRTLHIFKKPTTNIHAFEKMPELNQWTGNHHLFNKLINNDSQREHLISPTFKLLLQKQKIDLLPKIHLCRVLVSTN